MKKIIVALFAVAVFFAPLSAKAVTEAEVIALTCNQILKTDTEDSFVKIFQWTADTAGLTEEAEFIKFGQWIEQYCMANPNATFKDFLDYVFD